MALILDGTNGLSDVDGTAGTPAIRGSDTNTGIFFPAADTIAFAEGGVESARFDSAGNLGIGTSTPAYKVEAIGSSPAFFGENSTNGTQVGYRATIPSNSANCFVGWVPDTVAGINGDLALCPRTSANAKILFFTGSTTPSERARIDSSGNLLVNTTVNPGTSARFVVSGNSDGSFNPMTVVQEAAGSTSRTSIQFYRNSSAAVTGTITTTNTATAYVTSSDYRLKHDIAPMTGALAKVAALKPVTYKWNVDNSVDEGFIAHELAEVCPSAVVGEKDAVDAEGNPQYQGIDTSFLAGLYAAAIQELKAINDAQAQTIESLTARVVALEQA